MKINDITFGDKLFDEQVMKVKLPSPVFSKWEKTKNKTDALDRVTADAIAHAMKEWAIEKGCTHFTHWFQPLTGTTAEKHDAFIDMKEGQPIMKFSGKNLIKGEPDASSFPSGGLRATFEARGYTYWDCTSPAFIKDNILCIPTIFVSYNGESLDMKEPLLKSMDAVSKEATKIVNLFGDKDCTSVYPSVGLEQEYFLVDRHDFMKRSDLVLTGTTLIGSLPPKGQELEDHYLGLIPTRVKAFMDDVNKELWELGIYAKSEHNEVAPGQFELACIFANSNIAIDQNNIIMDVLTRVALKHDFVCLLAEKPYKGVNGSGKHNNYSLITDTGTNLLDPGKNPHENIQFLTFVSAIIAGVDKHPELIRLCASNPGNDYRLGANEAPPAIVSIYLGDVVEEVLNSITNDAPTDFKKNKLKDFGISSLSYLPHDNSDRNRTSPVAFTGNKFEFRMLGSSMNAANLNITINTIIADELREIAEKLDNLKYRQDIRKGALEICAELVSKHKKILFSGDGYSENWVKEAQSRGLPNIRTFYEAIEHYTSEDTIALFTRNDVLSKEEILSRGEVFYEDYAKKKVIEAKALIDMVRSEANPVVRKEIRDLKATALEDDDDLIVYLSSYIKKSKVLIHDIEELLVKVNLEDDFKKKGEILLHKVCPLMEELRASYDTIEKDISKANFTYPTYKDLFFDVDR